MANYCNTCADFNFSLEELKDLSDKPESMDLFLPKLESVSKEFIGGTHLASEFHSFGSFCILV